MKKSLSLLLVFLAATAVFAQMQSDMSAFLQAMNSAMKRMDQGMSATQMSGDPDHDFTAMMMPHHQGAIDMAKVELKFGKDPVLRRLAQEILADQQSEIDVMRLWLEKRAAHGAERGPTSK